MGNVQKAMVKFTTTNHRQNIPIYFKSFAAETSNKAEAIFDKFVKRSKKRKGRENLRPAMRL
jgi:hypothetical protein